MHCSDLIDVLERIAPLAYAESWDNTGLLVGSSSWPLTRALLTIDLTADVLCEACDAGASMIVTYHPLIFEPIKSVVDRDPIQRIVVEAIRNSIAVYSPHTALDAMPGGVNDWLADGLGDADVQALQHQESLPQGEQLKIVTFCPENAVDSIRNALASIGAGRIGHYSLCSFELRGQGTFLGGDETNPAVGARGSLQRVDEVRLEMVLSRVSLPLAIMMLRQSHPYEEPPIEVYAIQDRSMRDTGAGRRMTFDQPISLDELVRRIKKRLGVEHVFVASSDRVQEYRRIGLCVGAGGSLLDNAIAQGCEAFITGEMRHHSVLDAVARGCTVLLAGHTNTERGYLPVLRKKILEAMPGLVVDVSGRDRDPLRMM